MKYKSHSHNIEVEREREHSFNCGITYECHTFPRLQYIL